MFDCTCVQRCSTTASYGRKLVETTARPSDSATAHRIISSGLFLRSSIFQCDICSVVIRNCSKILLPPGSSRLEEALILEPPYVGCYDSFDRIPGLHIRFNLAGTSPHVRFGCLF